MGVRVSLCLIVKDEEANLPACLASVGGLADEVVVVDTGSTDRTRELAAALGARVFDFPWRDDFAAARNESLSRAMGDWIFWMDADDRLDADNHARLARLLASLRPDDNTAYLMKCLCFTDAAAPALAVDHVRLFRNDARIRWQYRVHEQVLPALREVGADVRSSDVVIRHQGYTDPAACRRKDERNLRLLLQDHAEHPDNLAILYNLGKTYVGQGELARGLPLLERCVVQAPNDYITPQACSLLAFAYYRQGRNAEALAVCQGGRTTYPQEGGLLYIEGLARHGLGDLAGAAACLAPLLDRPRGGPSAAIDLDLDTCRYRLGLIALQQGRPGEAEERWRALLADRPDHGAAWMGLADLWLAQGRLPEVEQAARRLRGDAKTAPEGVALEARALLARGQLGAARRLLEEALAAWPRAFWPRVAWSQLLLQEGRDAAAAERALREVLALDPGYGPARHHLAILLGRPGHAEQGPPSERPQAGEASIVVRGW